MTTSEKSLKTVVAEIKIAHSVSDYIRQSGVKLTANGGDKWKGLCPFHNEKSPSFTVSDHFQNFHCFGCGASGDLLAYVMRTENLEFMDALKKLAEEKGIELELRGSKEGDVDYKSLRECLREAANFFVKEYLKLPADHVARREVTHRGLTEKNMHYGYSPENRTALYSHLKKLNFSDETILAAGVATQWEESGKFSDFWSGRLMFIITDITGKPIGFAGRKLFEEDKRAKFVNSKAGPLFDKSSALFNVSSAKKLAGSESEVYVAEGQFDVAAFVEAGAHNVVASSGTAFTARQGQILQRLVGDSGKVIFAFDGDKAGVKAALTVFKNVPSLHSSAYVVQFPEGQDPCDYRLEKGNEALLELAAKKRISLLEFVLNAEAKKFDLSSPLERTKYLQSAGSILKTIASQSLRESFIRVVALHALADVSTVETAVAEASPLELREDGEAEAVEMAPRSYEEVTEVTEEELIAKLQQERYYNIAARLINLAVLSPVLIDELSAKAETFPEELRPFIAELAEQPREGVFISESFTSSRLAKYLLETTFFTTSHLDGYFKHDEFFATLYDKLQASYNSGLTRSVQRRVQELLENSNDQGAAFLEKAIAREEEQLAKLRAKRA